MNKQISRRQFILRSIEGAVATSIIAPSVFATPGPGPRLGIVGLGKRGRAVLDACIHGSITVAALCDVNPVALRRGCAYFPEAEVYPGIEQLAASAGVDAVAVATPRASDLAEAALRRGKHVFLASADRPDLQGVDRLARLAGERSLQVGLAPYDPSWDIDGLDRLLAIPANIEGAHTRLSLFGANDGSTGSHHTFGLDLLHHAVRCAGNCAPTKVRAVSAPAKNRAVACWSASFILGPGRAIDLHAQTLKGLNPGEMSIIMETSARGNMTRVVVDSVPDAGAGSLHTGPRIPGLDRFLAAARGMGPAREGTELSLGVMRWSCLLRSALAS